MQSYITQRGSPEKGIAQSMRQHVAVRMGDTPFGVVYAYSPDNEGQPIGERMHVVSVPYSVTVHICLFRTAI